MITLSTSDPSYPSQLARVLPTTTNLQVTRTLNLGPRRIAIVGARDASPEGCSFAYDLAYELASLGAIVVSGGALGVDAAAHRGALAAKGQTFCVLPGTPEVPFPSEHRSLFRDIEASEGALVYLEGARNPLRRHHFFSRNAVLAALSDALVVAEAGIQSGARNAAKAMRTLGRPVFSVAGAPWEPHKLGGVAELALGARPVIAIATLLRDLGFGQATASESATGQAGARPIPQHPYLTTQPAHLAALAERLSRPVPELRHELLIACLMGEALEGPPDCFSVQQ
jgi:DNA processing protein